MLLELAIRNFAIIDRLSLALGPGFNVLTGETGAGKSILIDAVGGLLGGRLGAEFVRAGATSAHIQGVFAVPEPAAAAVQALLEEYGLESEDGELILTREIQAAGRTTARVNGRAVPVSVLQAIGERLIDLHGQSQHLSLLRVASHLDILDEFADLRVERAAFAAGVAELRAVQREIASLLADERELARRIDLLQFQVEEIERARLQPGEDVELARERTRLANAERLSAAAAGAYLLLYEGADEQPAAIDLLGRALDQLGELARLDPVAEETRAALESALYSVEDVARSVRRLRDGVEHNPERLAEVEERLELIRTLQRKYGSSIEEVIAFGRRAAEELDAIQHSEERLEALRTREAAQRRRLGELAADLSARRQAAGTGLAETITAELGDLNMRRARLEIAFRREVAPDGLPVGDDTFAFDATGIDRVEFLVSPNPGEPVKPLSKIGSGGELARVMLAIKGILSRADATPTLIFDEVDTGIGGRTGQIVGEKLWRLSLAHQVVCVTHLPQVACFADRHLRVGKEEQAGRTVTTVRELDEAERTEELAAMLAGEAAVERARETAREMLAAADAWKAAQRAVELAPKRRTASVGGRR